MKWFVTLNKQMAHLIRPLGNDHFLYLLLLCGSLFGRQKRPLPQCDPEPPKLCSALWHIAGPRNMSVLCTGDTKLTLDSAKADFQKRYDTELSSSWHLATSWLPSWSKCDNSVCHSWSPDNTAWFVFLVQDVGAPGDVMNIRNEKRKTRD